MVFQATECSSLLGLGNLEFSAAIFPTLKLQNSIVICGSHHVDQLVEENKIQHVRDKFFRPLRQFFVLDSKSTLGGNDFKWRLWKHPLSINYLSRIGCCRGKNSNNSLLHRNLADKFKNWPLKQVLNCKGSISSTVSNLLNGLSCSVNLPASKQPKESFHTPRL